jgi:fatty-acyl-CoA synthase
MYPGQWAKIHGDKAAIIDAGTGEEISYQDLDDRSNRLAQLMYAKGLRRGDHMAIFMENNIRYFECVWAAFRSGIYCTPVNRYLSTDEAAYILNDCEAEVIVSSTFMKDTAVKVLPMLERKDIELLMVDGSCEGYKSYEKETAKFPAEPLQEQPLGTYMIYSSGSTGKPKGIMHHMMNKTVDAYPPKALLNFSHLWKFDENSVYISPAPNYHSAPMLFVINVHRLGGTAVVMPKFEAEEALRIIEKYKATHSQWVPTMFNRMLKLPKETRDKYDVSSLVCALHSAAPCPVHIKQKMIDWWGPVINEFYGASEGTGQTHITSEEWLKKPGSVGKAFIGTLHICDDEGNELPTGESGHVYFELPRLSFAYKGNKEKMKSAVHPFHENWACVGDVGYVDEDGYLFLNDRSTFMIISGGVNIYPQEIEDVLLMHPKVADAAVFGVPNEEFGEEVKAVVQLDDYKEASEAMSEELIAFSREHLAHYKCPRSVDFMEQLPRLDTGKLYKKPLKDKYWQEHGSRIL